MYVVIKYKVEVPHTRFKSLISTEEAEYTEACFQKILVCVIELRNKR